MINGVMTDSDVIRIERANKEKKDMKERLSLIENRLDILELRLDSQELLENEYSKIKKVKK